MVGIHESSNHERVDGKDISISSSLKRGRVSQKVSVGDNSQLLPIRVTFRPQMSNLRYI